MARVTLVDRTKQDIYVQDVERKQREAAVEPPGQDRYLDPIDKADLKSKLEEIGGGSVTDAEVDNVISGTVGDGSGSSGSGDDVSLSNIDSVVTTDVSSISSTNATEQQEVQDILSYHFVETGKFKLSFDDGTIAEMVADGWVKVFPDDAAGLYSL